MNVLPVLADLSSTKPDLPSHGVGSSVGNFAHLLDQTLSRTTSTGGYAAGGSGSPNAPYVSPARQEPRPRRQSSAGDTQSPHENGASRQSAQSGASRSEGASSHRSERNAASSRRSSNNEKAKAPNSDAGSQSDQKTSKSDGSKAAHDKHSTKETKTSSADKANKTKKVADGKKKASHTAKPGTSGVPFPGALILAGVHKGGTAAGKQSSSKLAKVAELAAGKNLLKGSHSPKDAKKTPTDPKGTTGTAAKATKTAPSTGSKPGKKHVAPTGAMPAQLLSASLSPSNNTAAPQNLGAAVHPGPVHPNAQQDPNAAAGHNTTASQTAGITIIDLRQHNDSSGSSTGQNNGQSHSNDGGNIRLFQLADGGSAGSIKVNGQGGAARAAGAPAAGQSFSAFTDQIVKQTGILLKNNNSGEIRLVLKPEHLGKLRIKLDLNNNSLSGKIFVQNHEALKLVQQNLATLYRALRDSGFTATELNVSVGGRDNGEKSRERSSPLPSTRAISGVKGFDNQAPALDTTGSYYSLVNLVI